MSMHINALLAYIDPGTGSYCFQLLIAGIAAVCFGLSTFKAKITTFFKGREKTSPPEAAQSELSKP